MLLMCTQRRSKHTKHSNKNKEQHGVPRLIAARTGVTRGRADSRVEFVAGTSSWSITAGPCGSGSADRLCCLYFRSRKRAISAVTTGCLDTFGFVSGT